MSLELLKNLDNSVIPHKQFKIAQKGILSAIELSQFTGVAECAVLVGPAGSGKTKICESILRKFKPYKKTVNHFESTITPAFYTSIPSPVTIKGVAINMLSSLGADNPHQGNLNDIQNRLGVLLKNSETQVILLDELQHLMSKSSSNVQIKDWIKFLINEYKIPIVVVGTPECESLIDSDKQLARRFVRRFHLRNFPSPMQSNLFGTYLKGVKKQFQKVANIAIDIDLTDPNTVLALYVATGGNPSDISQLFKQATYTSFINKQMPVSYKHFVQASQELNLAYSKGETSLAFNSDQEELIDIILHH